MKLYIAGKNRHGISKDVGIANKEVLPETETLEYVNGLSFEYCRLISFFYPQMVRENTELKKEITDGKK